jgi:hypothetical protein
MEWVKIGDDLWQSIRNYVMLSQIMAVRHLNFYSENNDVEHETMKMEQTDVES